MSTHNLKLRSFNENKSWDCTGKDFYEKEILYIKVDESKASQKDNNFFVNGAITDLHIYSNMKQLIQLYVVRCRLAGLVMVGAGAATGAAAFAFCALLSCFVGCCLCSVLLAKPCSQ